MRCQPRVSLLSSTVFRSSSNAAEIDALSNHNQKKNSLPLTSTSPIGVWMQATGYDPVKKSSADRGGSGETYRDWHLKKAFAKLDRESKERYTKIAKDNLTSPTATSIVIRYMYDKFSLDGKRKAVGGTSAFPHELSRAAKHKFLAKLYERLPDEEKKTLVVGAKEAYAKIMGHKRQKLRERENVRYFETYTYGSSGAEGASISSMSKSTKQLVPSNASQRWYPGMGKYQQRRAEASEARRKKHAGSKPVRIEGRSNAYFMEPETDYHASSHSKTATATDKKQRKQRAEEELIKKKIQGVDIPIEKVIAKHEMEMTPGLSKQAKRLTAISMWRSFSSSQRQAVLDFSANGSASN